MKAILIIIAIFGIQISTMVAGNVTDEINPAAPKAYFCPECPLLISKVPLEAHFWEMLELSYPLDLTPMVPGNATFDDVIDFDRELMIHDLAPLIPLHAEFDDNEIIQVSRDGDLAPVIEVTAGFDDTF
ncbi:MAG: hypothetical protein ISR57_01930 [Bacteroidales bacterium]|nr:hypothetical protein [Bacteroidales bacterium]